MLQKSISVFLPAFNESDNIEDAVTNIYNYLSNNFKDFEIIVIDDGSTDDTLGKLKRLQKKKLVTKIITHPKNLGYGAALRNGFLHSSKDLIFYTDADNQFDITELEKLLPLIRTHDIVSGYRIHREDPLSRIFIASVYNIILKSLFDMPYKDIDASFKLYRREIFDKIKLKAQTGLIDAEVLIKAKKKGLRIAQVGVTHYPRIKGQSMYEFGKRNNVIALVKPEVIINIFKEIGKLWPELR